MATTYLKRAEPAAAPDEDTSAELRRGVQRVSAVNSSFSAS